MVVREESGGGETAIGNLNADFQECTSSHRKKRKLEYEQKEKKRIEKYIRRRKLYYPSFWE